MQPPRRRSIFADRLSQFDSFAFDEDAIYAHRGQWADFLLDRIGPAFDGRVVFEIGCSDGALLSRLAAKHPTTAFIGLDWKFKSVFIGAECVSRLGLRNVVLLRGRGQDVAKIFGPSEVDEMLLFHPDPCATPTERPTRLFNKPFLMEAHAVLRGPGATLTLKTDHPGYYGWALALLGLDEPQHFAAARERAAANPSHAKRLLGEPRVRASDLLDIADRPPICQEVIERFEVTAASADVWNDAAVHVYVAGRIFSGEKTDFEQRFLRKKQPIYYLELRKR